MVEFIVPITDDFLLLTENNSYRWIITKEMDAWLQEYAPGFYIRHAFVKDETSDRYESKFILAIEDDNQAMLFKLAWV